MKKFILFLAFCVFTVAFTFGQQDDCGSNSIFSQSLLDPPSAYSSDEAGSTQLDNFYGLTEDIAGMTFWGFMYDGSGDCYSSGPQDFEVKFYQDNSGNVGTLVTTFTVTVTPSNTGQTFTTYWGPIVSVLRYDVSFPANISLSDGWFSVSKRNPNGNSCRFYFLNTTNGDDHSAYIPSGSSTINYATNNRAFCLTGVPPIPISKWALVFGILLILGFIVIRYKTKMA